MYCRNCGRFVPIFRDKCGHCGADHSPYLHLVGVVLGIIGSLIGFTLFHVPGALIGGFFGILLYVAGSRRFLRNSKQE